ncbi:hypothetical protein ACPPVW_18505 [Leifsonia sp. McL0607]|uniref:hypothetical protein n=1 Tax=Leifsonia sp. McL0607 TaxID=3415672 RepID=UPI003CF57A96
MSPYNLTTEQLLDELHDSLDAAQQVGDLEMLRSHLEAGWITLGILRGRIQSSVLDPAVRACRVCGCTDADCSGCIERTGEPCSWVSREDDLCTACARPVGDPQLVIQLLAVPKSDGPASIQLRNALVVVCTECPDRRPVLRETLREAVLERDAHNDIVHAKTSA